MKLNKLTTPKEIKDEDLIDLLMRISEETCMDFTILDKHILFVSRWNNDYILVKRNKNTIKNIKKEIFGEGKND